MAKIFHIKEISVAFLSKVVKWEMANEVLGKKSEQKEAWEENCTSACHIYFIDEKLRPGGREEAGRVTLTKS